MEKHPELENITLLKMDKKAQAKYFNLLCHFKRYEKMHIVKNCHLMRHFFVCRLRQNIPIGIDLQYMTKQYACFRFV